MRKIEGYNRNSLNWEEVKFGNLSKGDVFRIFDDCERYVNTSDGNNVWIAISEPYINLDNDGVLTIDTLY